MLDCWTQLEFDTGFPVRGHLIRERLGRLFHVIWLQRTLLPINLALLENDVEINWEAPPSSFLMLGSSEHLL